MSRDLRIGRWRGPTLTDAVSESVGDALEAVGAAVVAGESRPRTLKFNVPIHGPDHEPNVDPREVAYKMRRQLRALIENSDARLGLYMAFAADPELNGWIALAGGDLAYEGEGGAGPTLGEFRLDVDTAYRVGTRRRQRAARRVQLTDRRLATTPRDYFGTIYSTDFALQGAVPLAVLPPGVRDVAAAQSIPVIAGWRESLEGNVQTIPAPRDGDVISYEQDDRDQGAADVVINDRRGIIEPVAAVAEDFDAATGLDGWTVLTGNPADLSTSTGDLRATANVATEYTLERAGAIYPDGIYASARVNVGLAGFDLARTDDDNRITVGLEVDGATTVLRIRVIRHGVVAASAGSSLSSTPQTGRYYISAGWRAGRVTAEIRTALGSYLLGGTIDLDLLELESSPFSDEADLEAFAHFMGDRAGAAYAVRWTPTTLAARLEETRATAVGNVEDSYGWEEVYGPDQREPWEPTRNSWDNVLDAPILSNSLARVRPVSVEQIGARPSDTQTFGLAVDAFVAGVGWVEQGRVLAWTAGQFAAEIQVAMRRAEVIEWTPERGVLKYTVAGNAAEGDHRGELIVTLERGDLGPRFELYMTGVASNPGSGYKRAAKLIYVPKNSGHHSMLQRRSDTGVMTVFASESGWAGSVTYSQEVEPWVALGPNALDLDNPLTAVLTPAFAPFGNSPATVQKADDTAAYGTTRRGLGFITGEIVATTGYVSLRLAFVNRGLGVIEAETYRVSGSQVADAGAINGQTAADAAVADGTVLVDVPEGTHKMGASTKVALAVRYRVSGSAGRLKAQIGGLIGSTVTLIDTAGAYLWAWTEVELSGGDMSTDDPRIRLYTWGSVRVDRILVFPLERRYLQNGQGYDGVRDQGATSLWQTATLPELTDR